ncbi:hypothetical protein ACWEK5_37505 [Rhodococcus koreensis]
MNRTVEPVEQIQAADWTDMDLLTRELAGELLDREIDAESRLPERSEEDAFSLEQRAAASELRERRLRAMKAVRSGLSSPADPAATSPSSGV